MYLGPEPEWVNPYIQNLNPDFFILNIIFLILININRKNKKLKE